MTAQETAHTKLPKERTHFTELLLANHFEAIQGSEASADFKSKGNTTYEQLTCVGYNPAAKRLDATVDVKQSAGYSGDICTGGSQEYVRFFTSTDHGATWDDQGTVSFTVWDVAGPKPLEYAAKLKVDLGEKCCKAENLVLVRAILSWSVPPGGPDDPVVWGNSLDATIQVAPLHSGTLIELIECLDWKVQVDELATVVEPEQEVTFGTAKQLSPLELHEAYEATDVEPHRYLMTHAHELLESPGTLTDKLATPGFELFPGVDVDVSKLIAFWIDPQGNETYEQLGCLGLNPGASELVATIDVKLSSGYSGALCTNGSKELVAFWVDWEDGAGWHYVGTSAVVVHDFTTIPKSGLEYSVALPFPELFAHRRPCHEGPRFARVRAVLSWQTPPSTTNPYAVPIWGGHEETTILLPPGESVGVGGGPQLETIGRMDIGDIDAGGLATGHGQGIGFSADQSPFGGQVWFSGHVFNRFGTVFGGPGIYYRIWISTDGGANWAFMNTQFDVTTHHYLSGTTVAVPQAPHNLGAPWGDGWYPYLEDSSSLVTVDENTLGYWPSSIGANGQALIYLEAKDVVGSLGSPTAAKKIKLDNEGPTSLVGITSGGGSCGDFKVGDVITGSYSTHDNESLLSVGFSLEPPAPGSLFSLTHAVTSSTPSSESGNWTLDTQPAGTAGLNPCGYVLRFDGQDRTIFNSAWVGLDGPAFTGFCLKK